MPGDLRERVLVELRREQLDPARMWVGKKDLAALLTIVALHQSAAPPDQGFCDECGHVLPCATLRIIAKELQIAE